MPLLGRKILVAYTRHRLLQLTGFKSHVAQRHLSQSFKFPKPGIIGQLDAKVSEKDVHIHAFFLCCPAKINQLVKVLI